MEDQRIAYSGFYDDSPTPRDMLTSQYLKPASVTLFGKRGLVDIIEDFKIRSFWIIHVGPKFIGKHPYKRYPDEGHTEKRRRVCEGRDREE